MTDFTYRTVSLPRNGASCDWCAESMVRAIRATVQTARGARSARVCNRDCAAAWSDAMAPDMLTAADMPAGYGAAGAAIVALTPAIEDGRPLAEHVRTARAYRAIDALDTRTAYHVAAAAYAAGAEVGTVYILPAGVTHGRVVAYMPRDAAWVVWTWDRGMLTGGSYGRDMADAFAYADRMRCTCGTVANPSCYAATHATGAR
jgi:hypothetical protein